MDGAAVAIAEPQPKPPRRISTTSSARNIKTRHVSAVRQWPPGCGRFPPPPQRPTLSDQCSPPPPPPPSLSLPSLSPVSLTPITPASTTTNSPPRDGKIYNIPVTNVELLVNGATFVSDSNAVADHVNQPLESPQGKIDNSNHLNQAAVEVPNGDPLVEKDKEKEKEKGGFSKKRWMNSKVYPPPKRRAVSAIRQFPLGCGRKPDFSLGLIDSQPVQPDPISSLVTDFLL